VLKGSALCAPEDGIEHAFLRFLPYNQTKGPMLPAQRYRDLPPDLKRAYHCTKTAAWKRANRERMLEQQRQYHLQHHEQLLAYKRRVYAASPLN
jgi:hypothetical protein